MPKTKKRTNTPFPSVVDAAPIQIEGHQICPFCQASLVMPDGSDDLEWGIIGSYPGALELNTLRPFRIAPMGWVSAGLVLHQELMGAGLSYKDFRVTNVWSHAPSDSDEEYNANRLWAWQWVRGCTHILLLGSEACQAFLGTSVMKVSGTWQTSLLLPHSKLMPAPNPAELLHGTVGELRLALGRFARIAAKQSGKDPLISPFVRR